MRCATSKMTPTTKRVEHSANIAAHQLLFTGRGVSLHNAYMLHFLVSGSDMVNVTGQNTENVNVQLMKISFNKQKT